MEPVYSQGHRDAVSEQWLTLSAMAAEAFRMGPDETKRLQRNRTARLIGSLPAIAGTRTPLRDGCSNLAVYIMSVRNTKSLYNHCRWDDSDIYARLRDIMHFNGGDAGIIRKGMALLALQMVNDYARDVEEDKREGKYNPILSQKWDYADTKARLLSEYYSIDSEDIDDIMSLSESGVLLWEG